MAFSSWSYYKLIYNLKDVKNSVTGISEIHCKPNFCLKKKNTSVQEYLDLILVDMHLAWLQHEDTEYMKKISELLIFMRKNIGITELFNLEQKGVMRINAYMFK